MHSILSRQALNNTQETQRPFPSIPNLHSIDDLRRMCEIRPSHAIHTHTYPVITAVCLLTHPATVIACTCGLLHLSARARAVACTRACACSCLCVRSRVRSRSRARVCALAAGSYVCASLRARARARVPQRRIHYIRTATNTSTPWRSLKRVYNTL